MQIFDSQLDVAKEAMQKAGAAAADIYAIGITNQRETVTVWDKADGKPIYRSIVWQCRRTADTCEQLKAEGLEPTIKEKTGLVCDPYFSASKLRWILQNVDGAAANDFLLSFQSDLSALPVIRPKCIETTALGAALLAGLGIGLYADVSETQKNIAPGRTFTPTPDTSARRALLDGWKDAVARVTLGSHS